MMLILRSDFDVTREHPLTASIHSLTQGRVYHQSLLALCTSKHPRYFVHYPWIILVSQRYRCKTSKAMSSPLGRRKRKFGSIADSTCSDYDADDDDNDVLTRPSKSIKSSQAFTEPNVAKSRNLPQPRPVYSFPEGPPNPLPGTNVLIDDAKFMSKLCLEWTEKDTEAFLASLPVKRMRRLPDSQIAKRHPQDEWIAECEQDFGIYTEYFRNRNFADKRPKTLHNKVHLTKRADWVDVLIIDQNAVLIEVNEAGDDIGIFGVVIRNFLPDLEVLQSAHLVAENCVRMGRDVRVS